MLTIVGANYLTDGSVLIARKFKVPELIIGLTIIAVGTSTPELVVSLASAFKGNSEMAVGNVIGSNIFNAMMIIGITVLVKPIRLSKENRFRNIPLVIVTSIVFIIMGASVLGVSFMPTTINRIEGWVLLAGFIAFVAYTIRVARAEISQKITTKNSGIKNEVVENAVVENSDIIIDDVKPEKSSFMNKESLAIPLIIGGLVALIIGGNLFLESAVNIAKTLGISEYVISVTLMAGGTSLPELVSCVVAARKGRSQLALGNVIGSNITNILLVLGGASIIHPLSLVGITAVDLFMVLISSMLLLITPYSFKKGQIDRTEGGILIAIYIGYVVWLIVK